MTMETTGTNSILVGADLAADHDECIVIGVGLKTTKNHQLLIGTPDEFISCTLSYGMYSKLRAALTGATPPPPEVDRIDPIVWWPVFHVKMTRNVKKSVAEVVAKHTALWEIEKSQMMASYFAERRSIAISHSGGAVAVAEAAVGSNSSVWPNLGQFGWSADDVKRMVDKINGTINGSVKIL